MKEIFELDFYGKKLAFETGRLAKQANAAVLARHGNTEVLVTAVMSSKAREGLDFFPLLVDYEERYYAAGKVPGGFIKREGRPSEAATLSGRVIDRSIRSLFEDWMRNDVHVVATVMSVDQVNPANILGINGASLALAMSGIPWNGPIGAVRVGCLDGELVVNPDEADMPRSTLDLTVAGHRGGITMVEAGANELTEDKMVDALQLASEAIVKIVDFIDEICAKVGKTKVVLPEPQKIEEIDAWMKENVEKDIYEAVQIHEKMARGTALAEAQQKAEEHFAESHPDSEKYIATVMEGMVKDNVRKLLLEEKKRSDGRAMDELRKITCEVDILTMTHGSALFTRGETQSLGVTTLGMIGADDQILDGLKLDEPAKRFILHYNFPPYSVGEIKPMRGPGRREIGHGALAERSIAEVLPDNFPYSIRVVSEIMGSNGSSSMASICNGCLALMDAGVPLKRTVAGISIGLFTNDDQSQKVLVTDILGAEDHCGDMDFKVGGTKKGITGFQVDLKLRGLTWDLVEGAVKAAHDARLKIIDFMESVIPAPRAELNKYAPRIEEMQIPVDKIGALIGPGGSNIRAIVEKTGAQIDIDDDGKVSIFATSLESMEAAKREVGAVTAVAEPGKIYEGKVTGIKDFGAFVEILPGMDGLCHISEFSDKFLKSMEGVCKVGDIIKVKCLDVDERGRIKLSRKAAMAELDAKA